MGYDPIDFAKAFLSAEVVTKNGKRQAKLKCPVCKNGYHELVITEGEKEYTVHCYGPEKCAGTKGNYRPERVLTALGLTRQQMRKGGQRLERPKQEIVACYPFCNEEGELLYEEVRLFPPYPRKATLRKPDGHGGWDYNIRNVRRVPFRLREILDAAMWGHPIYVTEGPKDADRLVQLSLHATAVSPFAGGWNKEFGKYLRGAKYIVVLPDKDNKGESNAAKVVESLHLYGLPVKVVRLGGLECGEDVSDWLDKGHSKDELLDIVEQMPFHREGKRGPAPSKRLAAKNLLLELQERGKVTAVDAYKVAAEKGISRRTLYHAAKELGISLAWSPVQRMANETLPLISAQMDKSNIQSHQCQDDNVLPISPVSGFGTTYTSTEKNTELLELHKDDTPQEGIERRLSGAITRRRDYRRRRQAKAMDTGLHRRSAARRTELRGASETN